MSDSEDHKTPFDVADVVQGMRGVHDEFDDDADTASQRSVSLSSPAVSPRHSSFTPLDLSKRESRPYTISTDRSSERDDASLYTRPSSATSATPSSAYEDMKSPPSASNPVTYPPPPQSAGRESVTSFSTTASTYSKKVRPESMLLEPPLGPLVLGIALVDFNHQVGPRIEFSKGAIFEDEEIVKILPFLALPDGAHLSAEDYSYFHLVPTSPNPTTIFGISCNRQIPTSDLIVKEPDMTRSTVQKAVVVLASKPVFGPIRDRLGVVTMALFEQKDFTETGILVDFYESLETSLRSQLTESGLYMGTSLRELVHQFRQRTLVLVKALILQKKIMFYGHPVERLCTYQYSLISLIPGLLQALEDCGSPPLASRAPTLARPNSLKTSDRRSMMAYLGLPLDLFGKDAFFQPYLPLQQIDLIKDTQSFLCGSTNSIVTQQKGVEILVNVETGAVEFKDARVERAVALTAADRKWMDEIVRDVNDGWDDELGGRGMQKFKGSDDYLRIKFEEYISASLSCVKYGDFIAKGEGSGVLITPGSGGDANSLQDFNPIWVAEFKRTNAWEVWQRVTDPMLFDIIEPRHPCGEKPSAISDIGLRLSEGIQELKLDQQLAPTREAISRTFTAGSTNFLKAVEGVRGRWLQRSPSSTSVGSTGSPPVEISKSDAASTSSTANTSSAPNSPPPPATPAAAAAAAVASPSRPASVTAPEAKERVGGWGAGIGSFFSSRAARFSLPKTAAPSAPAKEDEARKSDASAGGSALQASASTTDVSGQTKVEIPVEPTNSSPAKLESDREPEPAPVDAPLAEEAHTPVAAKEALSVQVHRDLGDADLTTPRSIAFSIETRDEEEHYEPAGMAL